MNPKFYVATNNDLMAKMDGKIEVMISTRGFMQSENKNKAGDYLVKIAEKLNELYTVYPDAATDLMEEAEEKIADAKTGERFLEEIKF